MKIGNREVGPGQPTYIIAEAGTGHADPEGRQALRAIDLAAKAKEAGADAVKFQMFVAYEQLFCPLSGDDKRWARWAETTMVRGDWELVNNYCCCIGIHFLASAFQPTAVRWLRELGAPAYKVASRAALTYPYDEVPGPFLVSTGMHKPPKDFWRPDRMELQCVSKYPTPLSEARWHLPAFGLSDHSGTPWPALDAMARGCPVIEVHFAIDKADAGNDAPVCLTTDELKLLCEARDGFAEMRSKRDGD